MKKERKFFFNIFIDLNNVLQNIRNTILSLTNSQFMDGSVFPKMLLHFDDDISKIKVVL